jgi:hypothetical protein
MVLRSTLVLQVPQPAPQQEHQVEAEAAGSQEGVQERRDIYVCLRQV